MAFVIAMSCVALALFAIRGLRWAYVSLVVVGLAYFPLKVGFDLRPHGCQFVFDRQLALFSFTNYAHIVLFAVFFLISYANFMARGSSQGRALLTAALATLVMGSLVEVAQGVSGVHNCRVRDLIPDATGVVLGAALVISWRRMSPSSSAATRFVLWLIIASTPIAMVAGCGRRPGESDIAGVYDLVTVHAKPLPAPITADNSTVVEARSGVLILNRDRTYTATNVTATRTAHRVQVDIASVVGTYVARDDSLFLAPFKGSPTGFRVGADGTLTYISNRGLPLR